MKLMVFGALSVFPGLIIVSFTTSLIGTGLLDTYLIKPFLAVALVEELIKLTILILVLYRNDHFSTINEGIIYSVAIAVGFAFAENIIYLTGSGDHIMLIITRSLTAVPLHAVCGAFMGYIAGHGKVNEKKYMGKALLAALVIHGLYNLSVSFLFPYYLLSIILMILSLLILKHLYSKNNSKNRV